MSATQNGGVLPCPECAYPIPISIPQILSGDRIPCPGCLLILSVDKEQSVTCLLALQKVYDAVTRVEETRRMYE